MAADRFIVSRFFANIHRFCTTSFTYVLITLLLLFILRPYHKGAGYIEIWESFFALVFFGVVFNCNHPFKVKTTAILIGLPALMFEWLSLYYPIKFFIVGSFSLTAVFMFFCTLSLLYNEVLRAKPSLSSIRPIVCVYFMIAYAFSYAYLLVEYLMPGSFAIVEFTHNPNLLFQAQYLASMIYYALGSLMEVGITDVTAVGHVAQTVFIIESMVGQFYIAILVSRLISLTSFLQSEPKSPSEK